MYAGIGDGELKEKGNALVSELARCQKTLKNGYLSAFPEGFFDRLREGQRVWAPFYTYHKIMAGLLDMYVHCSNHQALAAGGGHGRVGLSLAGLPLATSTCSVSRKTSLEA